MKHRKVSYVPQQNTKLNDGDFQSSDRQLKLTFLLCINSACQSVIFLHIWGPEGQGRGTKKTVQRQHATGLINVCMHTVSLHPHWQAAGNAAREEFSPRVWRRSISLVRQSMSICNILFLHRNCCISSIWERSRRQHRVTHTWTVRERERERDCEGTRERERERERVSVMI